MPISILMPALSPTMEEGKLAKWLVKEGDRVVSGDIIAEIETDKATMEVEAIEEGVIGKIVVPEGTDDVKVNNPIAFLLEEGEDDSALSDMETQPAAKPAPAADAPPPSAAPTPAAAPAAATPPAPTPAPAAHSSAAGSNGRIFASPLARRLAQENNIDISALSGTGPHGRVVKRDIETALRDGVPHAKAPGGAPATPATPAIDPSAVYALYDPDSFDAVAVDKMRGVIAERLTQSKRDIPHYYLTIDCVLDGLLAARKKLNENADGGKISVNDFVIKACGLALKQVPGVNASWAGGEILMHKHADISMAVAIDGGLITPIITRVEDRGLSEIGAMSRDLAMRARDRKLSPQEYQGGTFSVSNLGMFGIKHFTAVINPPQAAILAVGGGEARAIVDETGAVVSRTVMSVTLSCDHRVVDGAMGAQFLNAFKQFIEEPVRMLL